MDSFKTLNREEVYHGKILNIVTDTITLPNEKTALREMVIHNGASAIIPVMADGSIIMVKQYRHPAGEEIWEIPAGTLEVDEDPRNCAKRELEEETGYKSDDLNYLTTLYPAIGYSNEKIFLYVATNLQKGIMNLDPDEFITIDTFPLQKIIDMILDGQIKDAKTISAVLMYQNTAKQ